MSDTDPHTDSGSGSGSAEKPTTTFLLVGDDGTYRSVSFDAADDGSTYETLRTLLDGDVDVVAAADFDVWVNDIGLMRSDFAENETAGSLLAEYGNPGHRLAGPAVITRLDQRTGDTVGLDPATLRTLRHGLEQHGSHALPDTDPAGAADQQHASRKLRTDLDYQGHGLEPRTVVVPLTDAHFEAASVAAAQAATSRPPTGPLGGLCGATTSNGTPCRHPAPPAGSTCAAGH